MNTYPLAARLATMATNAAKDADPEQSDLLNHLAADLMNIEDPNDLTSISIMLEVLEIVSIYN